MLLQYSRSLTIAIVFSYLFFLTETVRSFVWNSLNTFCDLLFLDIFWPNWCNFFQSLQKIQSMTKKQFHMLHWLSDQWSPYETPPINLTISQWWFLTWVLSKPRGLVSQCQGFDVGLRHGSFSALIEYIYAYVLKKWFILLITKGSVNAWIELTGFSTFKVKNHTWRTAVFAYLGQSTSIDGMFFKLQKY